MRDSGFPSAFADAMARRGVRLSWLHQPPVEHGHPVSPAARRLTELLVWVRFHADHLPVHVERFTAQGGRERVEEMELGDGTTAHALARGFGPGILGLRWGW